MPRRTAAEAEQTRLDLLQEGRRYFARTRYADAALEDLVTRLGVTRGALYHHFGNKKGFFKAVAEALLGDLALDILRAAEAAGDGWGGLEAGCHAFLDAAADSAFRRIVLIDAPAVLGWRRWKELDEATTERTLRAGLEELCAAEALTIDDVEALAVALSGAMNELALWVAAQHDRPAALRRARGVISGLLAAHRAAR